MIQYDVFLPLIDGCCGSATCGRDPAHMRVERLTSVSYTPEDEPTRLPPCALDGHEQNKGMPGAI